MHFGKIPILILSWVDDGLIWDAFRHAHTSIVALQEDLEIQHMNLNNVFSLLTSILTSCSSELKFIEWTWPTVLHWTKLVEKCKCM